MLSMSRAPSGSMYMLNVTGDSNEPWGIPQVLGIFYEREVPM